MSEHTPALWVATRHKFTDGSFSIEITHPKDEHCSRRIAHINTNWLCSDSLTVEDEANAALIAAAPDLLAACMEFIASTGGYHASLEEAVAAKHVLTAIAKAKRFGADDWQSTPRRPTSGVVEQGKA